VKEETVSTQSTDVVRKWQETAKYWSRYNDQIRQMFMPLSLTLIDEAKIATGQRILDVAGGSGEPSLTIANVVGPDGSVMCTDVVAEMVEAAKHEASRLGISNIEFQQCSADSIPFADHSFDAAVSRLGAMFFPDALVALREMLRVVKPGGAVALAVWCHNELNQFMSIPSEVISRHVETKPSDPDALDAFRFADPGKLAGILSEAGATDVRERVFKFDLVAPISAEEFWRFRSEVSETLRTQLSKFSDEEKKKIADEVREAVTPFFPNDQMKLPAQILIVSGRK
jgi:ubiquinone/menaquinone biosynthesis C-methylase UbiE